MTNKVCLEAKVVDAGKFSSGNELYKCPHKQGYCLKPNEWFDCLYHPKYFEFHPEKVVDYG